MPLRKTQSFLTNLVKVLVLPFLLSATLWTCADAQEAVPNIILMMGDDHGREETGYNGHPHVRTPVLDEIAATSLRFETFYSAHPSCSPTRGSFLTGRHPNRYGTFAPGWSFRPEEITLGHILSKAGYQCGHFGKWHVGAVKAGSPTNPGAMGFHYWLSHDNFFELNPSLSRNGGPPEVLRGESSEVIVRDAMQFIDRAHERNQPFFTIIWFGSPHEPYSGLPKDLELYDDLPKRYSTKKVRLTSNETGSQTTRTQGEVLRERYAEITAMDRAIGTLRSHLKEKGLRENTVLFYCGDNGTSADASLASPYRGVKGQVYEGGVLVPGLIEWPARISQPVSIRARATTSDILPTLCSVLEQPLPDRPIDGIDLVPVISQRLSERTRPLYFWEFAAGQLSKSERLPYIDPELQKGTTPLAKLQGGKATRDFTNLRHPSVTEKDYLGPRAIIDKEWKLVIHDGKNAAVKFELFNLNSDPYEKSDMSPAHPEIVASLKGKLRTWQESVLQSLTGSDYR